MSDEKDPKRGKGWLTWLAVALIVLALYVLSVGPTFRLSMRSQSARRTWRAVYAPLIWLLDQNNPVARVFGAYVDLWVPPPEAEPAEVPGEAPIPRPVPEEAP